VTSQGTPLRSRLNLFLGDPAKATVVAGWIGRLVAALAQFGAIRILTQMLGVEGYGAHAVITGLLAWFMLADFGLGSSLQNHISAARVENQRADAAIWSTSIFLTLTTCVLAALLALTAPWIGPFLLKNSTVVSRLDAQLAFLAFGVLVSGTAAAGIILKIFFANYQGYWSHLITVLSAIMGVASLAIAERYSVSHRLVWAIVAFYSPGWLITVCAIMVYLARNRTGPSKLFSIDYHILLVFWKSARWFLLFAILAAFTLNLDYLILSRTVKPADIAVYSIFSKVSTLVIALFASVLSAYWPVSSEAIRKGDFSSLRSIVRRALLIGMILTFGMTAGMLVFRALISRLLSPDTHLEMPILLVPAFFIYCLARVWTDTFSMVIISADRAWVQCMVVPIQAMLSLGLGYWGALHYGLIGYMAGLIASFAFTVVWALPLYVKLSIIKHNRNAT
jgi:O-antigen/teichoic acid export membrane protein